MSDIASPTLTAVVGTRNRLGLLRLCLQSLIGKIQTAHEIVVVDLGSTDGTLEYLCGLLDIRVVSEGKPAGQAQNLNPVFKASAAKYICWLSDDNVVLEGMLDLAVSILEQNPDIGMVALKVKDVLGRTQPNPYNGGIWPTGVLNCNQGVIRASLFRQVAFFDEQYGTYGVDPDLTTKVLLAGHKVVLTKKVAIHHYRDHVASPGALDLEGRRRNKRIANETYRQKYKDLIVRRPLWRRILYRGFSQLVIHPAYDLARRLGISLETRLGYNLRDWTNLLYAQYVSKLDFWENRRNPYYLVQSIPASVRQQRLARQ